MPRATETELQAGLSRMLGDWDRAGVARYEEHARTLSAEKRRELAREGKALSDGSYPVETESDLRNAATLAASGHGNVSGAMALIRKRAKALGVKVQSLPGFGSEKAADAHDLAVQRSIEDAIRLQESDPDQDPADKRVLALLKQALAAQRGDTE